MTLEPMSESGGSKEEPLNFGRIAASAPVLRAAFRAG